MARKGPEGDRLEQLARVDSAAGPTQARHVRANTRPHTSECAGSAPMRPGPDSAARIRSGSCVDVAYRTSGAAVFLSSASVRAATVFSNAANSAALGLRFRSSSVCARFSRSAASVAGNQPVPAELSRRVCSHTGLSAGRVRHCERSGCCSSGWPRSHEPMVAHRSTCLVGGATRHAPRGPQPMDVRPHIEGGAHPAAGRPGERPVRSCRSRRPSPRTAARCW
jgi:hypothetical protein